METPITTTDDREKTATGISRRRVLQSTALTTGVFGLGLPLSSTTVLADEHTDGRIDTCNATLDIVLALDYSGSIGSALWGDIESGAESFVDVLNDDNQLGVVTFGDTGKAYDFGTQEYLLLAQDGTTDNRPAMKAAIPGVAPPNENGTHMAAALDLADDILDGQGRDGKEVIVLLTDGEPNYQNGIVGNGSNPPEDEADGTVGGVSGYVPTATTGFDPEGDGDKTYAYTGGSTGTDAVITDGERDETEAVATVAKADGTRIVAVGIGSGVDDDYLRDRIATAPEDYVQVANSSELGAALRNLLSEICDECDECEDEGLLAKYEFECVETVDDECVAYDFVLETGDESLVSYTAGSYVNKDGEEFEPMTATFDTGYCTVYAVVKAGRGLEVQELVAEDGQVTAEYIAPHAISFVAFFCTEDAAEAFAESFPSNRGGGPRAR
ncbi:vWA domain-containing protein [Haloarchaeobius litoreus]|uniref:VWA domain-containing protein n=1 Tax=Haloarchaeobius litoreus TaxID=755306 RepID=A0ABD6DL40_9EURY|nr:vWA domain-containing protein [Haloarchaeobius litoreus]